MSALPTIIKRYTNRKLYDTSTKRYIALEDIARRIRQGGAVQVIDDVSGEDITTLTLMQIIVEQEKKQAGFLPGTFLAELIRVGGQKMSEMRQIFSIPPLEIPSAIEGQVSKFLQEHELPTRQDLDALKVKLDELDQKISTLPK
jgi:polyhydroxyalkanoate synthesis repressor PhaR